jgi:hypothetical protein
MAQISFRHWLGAHYQDGKLIIFGEYYASGSDSYQELVLVIDSTTASIIEQHHFSSEDDKYIDIRHAVFGSSGEPIVVGRAYGDEAVSSQISAASGSTTSGILVVSGSELDQAGFYPNRYSSVLIAGPGFEIPTYANYGDTNTYSDVATETVTGAGEGMLVSVSYSLPAREYEDVYATFSGSGYVEGDQIVVRGDLLGGTTPENDLTFTVSYTEPGYTGIESDSVQGVSTANARLRVSSEVDFTVENGEWSLTFDLDSQGFVWTPQWQKTFGGLGSETIRSVAVDHNTGEIYLAAYSDSENNRAIVFKLDSDGNTIWTYTYSDQTDYTSARTIHVDSAGNVILVSENDDDDAVVTKISSAGAIIWQTTSNFIDGGWDGDVKGAVDKNDDVIISGEWYNSSDPASRSADYMFAKLSGVDGTLIWNKVIGTESDDYDEWDYDSQFVASAGDSIYRIGYTYLTGSPSATFIRIPIDGVDDGTYGDWRVLTLPLVFENSVGIRRLPINSELSDYGIMMDLEISSTVANFQPLLTITLDEPSSGEANGALIFADGTVQTTASYGGLQQVRVSDSIILSPSNIGKHLFMTDNSTVTIPDVRSIEFPIGALITVVSSEYDIYLNAGEYYDSETDSSYSPELFGVGYLTSNTAWVLPARSIARLLKVDENVWYIDAQNLIEQI